MIFICQGLAPFRQEILSNSVDIGRHSRSNYEDTGRYRAVWEIT